MSPRACHAVVFSVRTYVAEVQYIFAEIISNISIYLDMLSIAYNSLAILYINYTF